MIPATPTLRLLVCGLLAIGAAACGGPGPAALPPVPPSVPGQAVPVPPPPQEADVQALDESVPPGEDGVRLREAVAQTDAKRFAEAIATYEDLHRRHPANAIVIHELALAYRLSKQPERAVALLMPVADKLDVLSLAGLASAIDEAGKGADAIAFLRGAIQRHPRSGLLYSELATTLSRGGDTKEAIRNYLAGIEVEPSFGATYFNLAKLLKGSRYRGLALVYGETFRLLEPNSPRSRETAGMMVKVCQESVQLEKQGSKTNAHISLAPDLGDTQSPASIPLANAFELTFGPGLVLAHVDGFRLASLHRARRAFLDALKKPTQAFDWRTIPIFPWLQALDGAGHLEAYDYWLYGPASPDEAGPWIDGHREAMEAMARYVAAHPLFPKQKP